MTKTRVWRLITLSAILSSVWLPLMAQTAHAESVPQFGIDQAYQDRTLAVQAGATWDRIDFHWDAYQPTGPQDWKTNDVSTHADVANDISAGLDVVGVITNPPAWATRNGSTPQNLDKSVDDPSNYWAVFVKHLVTQYASQIHTWIIWNEPDIPPGQPLSTWAGTEGEFYLLVKDASIAAHEVDPSIQIVFAGTTYWSDIQNDRPLFLQRVLDRARQDDPTAAAHGYYFDAVDIHIYSSPSQILMISQAYRNVLAQFGLNKPIWVSEINVVPWNDVASKVPRGGYRATLNEQASYMVQALAMARVAGIARVAVYKMMDGTIIGGEPYGLVRDDQSLRPAYSAYQVARKYLDGPGQVAFQTDASTSTVTINDGTRRTTVAWANGPDAVQLLLPPVGTQALLVSKIGITTTLSLPTNPAQPNYVLNLTPATANTQDHNSSDYIFGGDPQILVETGIGDPVKLSGGSRLFYPVTGFEINGAFLDYFEHRGGVRTFGYPISRPFQLFGQTVQVFQRRVLQMQPNGTVGQINLLDPGFLPYTAFNGATVPGVDPVLVKKAPSPSDPNYISSIFSYIQSTTPNRWNGLPVRFEHVFTTTVSLADAFPKGKSAPQLLPGMDLELWGLPTSAPAVDPADHNMVYQRFQRGIMQYNQNTGLTQGLLLGEYFKAILTGSNLPSDVDAASKGGPFYHQYSSTSPLWIQRPSELPNSDLTWAFERQAAIP